MSMITVAVTREDLAQAIAVIDAAAHQVGAYSELGAFQDWGRDEVEAPNVDELGQQLFELARRIEGAAVTADEETDESDQACLEVSKELSQLIKRHAHPGITSAKVEPHGGDGSPVILLELEYYNHQPTDDAKLSMQHLAAHFSGRALVTYANQGE